jgi:hypothetical protein
MRNVILIIILNTAVNSIYAQIGPHDYGPFSPSHFTLYNYIGTSPFFKPQNIVSIDWDGSNWEDKPDSFFVAYNQDGIPLSLTFFEYDLNDLFIGKELYTYNNSNNKLATRSLLYFIDSKNTWDTIEIELFNYDHKGNVNKWERQFYGDTTIHHKVVDSLAYTYDGDLAISYDRYSFDNNFGIYEPYERLEYKYDSLGALTDVYTMVYDNRIDSFVHKFHTRHFTWHNHRCRMLNRELHPTSYTIYAWEDSVFVPFEKYVLTYDAMDNITERKLYHRFWTWQIEQTTTYNNEYVFDSVLAQTTIENIRGQDIYKHRLVYFNQFRTGLKSNVTAPAKIGVFPNPTHDLIYFPESLIQQEYEVYTTFGKRILNGRVSESATVSLSELTPGTYFIRLPQTQQYTVVVKH